MQLIRMNIEIPTAVDEAPGSTHSSQRTAKKPQRQVSRRHSIASPTILLTHDHRADDALESAALDAQQHPMIGQDGHLSEPALSLGNLAFLLMPPKIVKEESSHLTMKMRRRNSCWFEVRWKSIDPNKLRRMSIVADLKSVGKALTRTNFGGRQSWLEVIR